MTTANTAGSFLNPQPPKRKTAAPAPLELTEIPLVELDPALMFKLACELAEAGEWLAASVLQQAATFALDDLIAPQATAAARSGRVSTGARQATVDQVQHLPAVALRMPIGQTELGKAG